MFWFKRKQIVVDAFTNQAGVHQYFPYERSSRNLPEWWKSLPKTNTYHNNGIAHESSTMKRCVGFTELFKNSWTIPMFTDLKISIEDDHWNCITAAGLADSRGHIIIVDSHSRDQFGREFDAYCQFKILMPWLLKEKTGVNFTMIGAYWNQTKLLDQLYVAPGVLNFKYQSSTNVSFFTKTENKIITINAGQPLAYLIPMTDKDVVIKSHLVSENEYRNMLTTSTYASKFVDRYKFNKRITDSQEKKCPFGFGK